MTAKIFATSVLSCLLSAYITVPAPKAAAAPAPTTAPATRPSASEEAFLRRVQSIRNLHQLGEELLVYANEHDGKFPPDLGMLATREGMNLSQFVCPAAHSPLPADYLTMRPQERAKWVNAHSDYIYVAAGKSVATVTSNDPLIYEKDDVNEGKVVNILFGDLHCELVKPAEERKRFGDGAAKQRTTTRLVPGPGQSPPLPLMTMNEANVFFARSDLSHLKIALMVFEDDNGRFPTTSEGLRSLVQKPDKALTNWKQYVAQLPTDPWGRPYVYRSPGIAMTPYELFSCGPDGKPDTADDVRP